MQNRQYLPVASPLALRCPFLPLPGPAGLLLAWDAFAIVPVLNPEPCPRPTQDDLSGADIKAMCTEAGLLALRERRMCVTQVDFQKAKEKVLYKKKEGVPEGLYM